MRLLRGREAPEMLKPVQTRDLYGDLMWHRTVADAQEWAQDNPACGVWKISWTDPVTGERHRLVRHALLSDMDGITPVWAYNPLMQEVLSGMPPELRERVERTMEHEEG